MKRFKKSEKEKWIKFNNSETLFVTRGISAQIFHLQESKEKVNASTVEILLSGFVYAAPLTCQSCVRDVMMY